MLVLFFSSFFFSIFFPLGVCRCCSCSGLTNWSLPWIVFVQADTPSRPTAGFLRGKMRLPILKRVLQTGGTPFKGWQSSLVSLEHSPKFLGGTEAQDERRFVEMRLREPPIRAYPLPCSPGSKGAQTKGGQLPSGLSHETRTASLWVSTSRSVSTAGAPLWSFKRQVYGKRMSFLSATFFLEIYTYFVAFCLDVRTLTFCN